jgi:hypothetical protein
MQKNGRDKSAVFCEADTGGQKGLGRECDIMFIGRMYRPAGRYEYFHRQLIGNVFSI